MYWLNKASAFVSDQGRVPMYWDDMLFKLAGLEETLTDPRISEKEVQELWEKNESKLDANVNLFPQNCIYIRWSYSYPLLPGNLNAIDWYKKHGLKAMAATSATSTPDVMMPSQNSRFRPIKEFCKVAIEKKMDGALLKRKWMGRYVRYGTTGRPILKHSGGAFIFFHSLPGIILNQKKKSSTQLSDTGFIPLP